VNDLQEKNVSFDSLEGKVGRVYMPKQDLNSMALNKMKVSHHWIVWHKGFWSADAFDTACPLVFEYWRQCMQQYVSKNHLFCLFWSILEYHTACLGMVCSVLMKLRGAIYTMRYW